MKFNSSLDNYLRRTKRSLERNLERFTYRDRIQVFQAQVEEITENFPGEPPVFLFASGLSWNRQLMQRPQQLARALAEAGCLVFYLEPKPQEILTPFSEVQRNLFWANVPVDAFATTPDLWLYQLTWSLDVSQTLKRPKIWYDIVDDLSTFRGDPAELARNHQERIECSQLLTVTAQALFDEVVAVREDALLSPNAVDVDHFSRVPANPPEDLRPILNNHKLVIGYHGAFDHWFDYDLLGEIARRERTATILLIGPDVHDYLKASTLLKLENVHWLGEKPYEHLPDYLYYIDVAMIPFILSPITHATSPIKMFEYMAMGKPIVASPMHEILQYPEVMVGSEADDFVKLFTQAFSLKDEVPLRQRLIKRAKENSWHNRAEGVLRKIREAQTTV